MILKKDILKVGRTQKPYGIKGEINILFQKTEYAELDTEFYFLEIDGIPVPFFIEDFLFVTDTHARVKFENLEDETDAARFVNLNVYIPRDLYKESSDADNPDWDYFIGFSVVEQNGKTLGEIIDVDLATINTLFIVKGENEEHLIPATEDFILHIDEQNSIIEMNLPEGLIE